MPREYGKQKVILSYNTLLTFNSSDFSSDKSKIFHITPTQRDELHIRQMVCFDVERSIVTVDE